MALENKSVATRTAILTVKNFIEEDSEMRSDRTGHQHLFRGALILSIFQMERVVPMPLCSSMLARFLRDFVPLPVS